MIFAHDRAGPVDSAIARRDPRWKLAGLALAAVAAASLRSPAAAAAAFAGSLVLVTLARLGVRWFLVRASVVAPLLLTFVIGLPFFIPGPELWRLGPVAVSRPGLELAFLVLFKAGAVLTLMAVLLATTPVHLVLRAAQSLRVPRLFVHLGLLTHRYVFVAADELARLRVALRVRGYRSRTGSRTYRTIGHVAGTLLVRSADRAERVAQAMRCRGFNGRLPFLAAFQTSPADVVLFLLITGVAAGLWLWDFSRG